ncbi:UDP-glucosyltransferase 74F2, partial [Prunus dulcis]
MKAANAHEDKTYSNGYSTNASSLFYIWHDKETAFENIWKWNRENQERKKMSKPHIVAIPYPAQGHVIPLMEFSQCLVNHGFKVTFVNTEHNHKNQLHLASLPDDLEPWVDRSELGQLTEALKWIMPGKLEELIENINQGESDRVTCVIADENCAWALEVAEKMNLKRVAFWPASAAALTLIFGIPKLIHEEIIGND